MKRDDNLMRDMDAWLVGTPIADAVGAMITLAARGLVEVSDSHEMLESGIEIVCRQLAEIAREGYKLKENPNE